ncbi:hypothetical protein A9Q74_17070 [Colwellia sp. 39_35_sub15_T18]|nr:hypothetical protein A9Q74_17070 [Colwellia sp. 39_35_sub15_T18]
MHRTQIYFEDDLISEIKKAAQQTNLSMSAYIRNVLKKELANKKAAEQQLDLSDFTGIWQDRDIDQEQLRAKAWK